MKILILTEAFWPHLGGIEKFTLTLMLELLARGHQCGVISSSMANLPLEDYYEGIQIFRLPLRQGLDKNPDAFQYALMRIKAIKQAFMPNIYHLNMNGPSYFYHLQTINIAKAPTVFSLHYLMEPQTQTQGMLAKILQYSDVITAPSKITLKHFHAVFPEYQHKSKLIHFGLESFADSLPNLHQDTQIITSWGRMVENKGFDYVLYALADLRIRFPDLKYFLIGDGPDKTRLQQLILALGLEDTVVFPQRSYTRHELLALLAQSRFVINPSHDKSECFGLVALEAMQMGKTVLTTKHPGLNELVIDGQTGLTFEFNNVEDLKLKISCLMLDNELLEILSQQAFQHAKKHYCLERMVSEYEKLFQGLCQS